jgi:hypothetical protein
MDARTKERMGFNEAAFRRVNESLRASTTLADSDRLFPFTCECGTLGCNMLVELTLPQYEAVRSHARRFFIVGGHEVLETERVVEVHERYTVVEKMAEAAGPAEATDPRA